MGWNLVSRCVGGVFVVLFFFVDSSPKSFKKTRAWGIAKDTFLHDK